MALPARKPESRVSVAEYLRREALSEVRHEYHDGEVLEMSGCTVNHGRINRNLTVALVSRLGNGPCEAFDSSMRVAIRSTRRYVYPDGSVICGPVEFDPLDPNRTTIINPRVIVEVLSPSTEAYDRGEKFEHDRMSPTVEEYLLIVQDRARVDGFLRQPNGSWNMETVVGLDAKASVRCLGLDLPLAELYARVEFPPGPTPPAEGEWVDEGRCE